MLAALGISQAVDTTESGLVKYFFPLIRAAFGLDLGALGILTAIPLICRTVCGPIWAMIADRFGRRRILILVAGVWGVFTIAAGCAPTYEALLVLFTISSIGTVASEPILNGLLPEVFRASERGRAFGLVRGIGAAVGIVLVPTVGMLSADPQGWRYALWVMGLVSILSGLMILRWVPASAPVGGGNAPDRPRPAFRILDALALFRIPTIVLKAVMLPLVTSVAVLPFYSTFLVDVRGYEPWESVILLGVNTLGIAVSSVIGGRLGDRWDRRFGPRCRIMLMQIYLVVFAVTVAAVTQLPFDGRGFVYPATLVMGLVFSIGFSGCVLPMITTVVPLQLGATTFSLLLSLVQGSVSAFLAIFAGEVAERIGLAGMFWWLMTVPFLLNAFLWIGFYRIYPRDRARQERRTATMEVHAVGSS